MSTAKVQAWETEDPTLVVFGTQQINEAFAASKEFYKETVGEVPEGLYSELVSAFLHGGRRWAADGVLEIEDERWPSHMVSTSPVDGWTPFLVVQW